MSNTYILLFSIVFLNGFERRFHKRYAIDGEPKQAGVPFQGVQCIARARNRARTADYVMKRGKPSPPVRKTTKVRTKPGFLVSAVGRRKAGTALEEGACDFQTHVARTCRAGDDPSKIAKDFEWGRLPRNIRPVFFNIGRRATAIFEYTGKVFPFRSVESSRRIKSTITKAFRGYPKRSVGSNARFRGTQKRRRPAALSISGRETQSRGCMGKAGRTGGRDIRNFQRPVLPAVI